MEMGTEDIALDLFGGCDFDMEMLCEESEDFTQSLYQQLANNSPSAHETSAQTSASDDPGRKFSDTSFVSALADGNPLQPMETSSIEDLKPVQPMMDTDENPEPIEKAEGSTVSKTNGKRRSSNVGRGSSAQQKVTQQKSTEDSAPLPPIVISPSDVDNISIQLEKNQQCACRDCGKLFNSVWYLKQVPTTYTG
jgi:hypothetical protein